MIKSFWNNEKLKLDTNLMSIASVYSAYKTSMLMHMMHSLEENWQLFNQRPVLWFGDIFPIQGINGFVYSELALVVRRMLGVDEKEDLKILKEKHYGR